MDTAEPDYGESNYHGDCPTRCIERRKKLCDDLPGLHTSIWVCVSCQREYGPEWEEYHGPGGLTVPILV